MVFGSAPSELGRITSLDALLRYVQKHKVSDCSREKLLVVVEYLAYSDTVLYFKDVPGLRDVVVVDPQWFGRNVVGRVLAPNTDGIRERTGDVFDLCLATVHHRQFCEWMTRVIPTSKFIAVPPKHMHQVVLILKELLVCCEVDGTYVGRRKNMRFLVFPPMLHPTTSVVPSNVQLNSTVGDQRYLLARRLRCDDACYLIPSGLFPKLQVRCRQLYDAGDASLDLCAIHIWFHGIHVQTHGNTRGVMQLSTESVDSRQYIDIVVWAEQPVEEHLGACRVLLDALVAVCEVQQREHHYGRVVLERYVLLGRSVVGADGSLAALSDRVVVKAEREITAIIEQTYVAFEQTFVAFMAILC